MNNSDVDNGWTSDMTDHFQALVGKLRIDIAETSEQQQSFKVFSATNIDLATSWVNQNRRKRVKVNRKSFSF